MGSRLFPKLTASKLHATTYLLGISLFSIAFLVFLNSSISFVVTDVIGQVKDVGDTVGTLGFADELLALVACPLWGLISDRVGVRPVAVIGYCIVGMSLVGLVQSTNVYPELLAGRLAFSIGGAACTTMVTAVLPAMTAQKQSSNDPEYAHERGVVNGHATRLRNEEREARRGSEGHNATPSVSSELTITPTRYTTQVGSSQRRADPSSDGSDVNHDEADADGSGTYQLAGFVGMFTGAGALVALVIFLPLPAYFQDRNKDQAESVRLSFYIVGAIALCVAIFIFFGLRHLPGEEDKNMSALFSRPYNESTKVDHDGNLHTTLTPAPSYLVLAGEAIKLGFTDRNIGLGYLGGFVARASSVGISLFIPLFVNAYFKRTGLCPPGAGDTLPDIKKNCQKAYKLAAALAGIAETAALLCAPIFGVVGGRFAKGRNEWPLALAAVVGIGGYIAFGMLRKPDPFHGDGGQWALIAVIMIGISQIGCIVCSLGLLGRGTNTGDTRPTAQKRPDSATTIRREDSEVLGGAESAPLLPNVPNSDHHDQKSRSHLKGSIAGIYSLGGGAGILILTKLGGALSDSWNPGAPFFIMAIFNAILLVAIVIVSGASAILRSAQTRSTSTQTIDDAH